MTTVAPDAIPVPELQDTPPAGDIPPLQQEIGDVRDGPPARRPRGRPRGSTSSPRPEQAPEALGATQPSPEDVQALGKALAMGFTMAGRLVAHKRGPHWLVSQEEAGTMGDAWAVALAPYMGIMAKYTPLLTALVVTVGVVGPRLETDATLAEERARTRPQPAPVPTDAPAPSTRPDDLAEADVTPKPEKGARRGPNRTGT